jgi:hypothetical protein
VAKQRLLITSFVSVLTLAGLFSTPAGADVPFRGSYVSYRNAVSALAFDKSAELTYNPYYGMSMEIAPKWWFGKTFFVQAFFVFSHEVTESDWTTMAGETVLGDVLIRGGASRFWTIPGAKIDLSGDLTLTTPASLASQARTLLLGISPRLRLSRSFKVLQGLRLSYALRATFNIHENTTSARDLPLIPGCVGQECDSFFNTGLRNSQVRLYHSFGAGIGFTKWLSLSTSFGVYTDYLYSAASDDRVSHVAQEPNDARYGLIYGLEVAAKPLPWLEFGLGASTIHPQQKPDSSYYTPLFNRYTTVYLDLRIYPAGLMPGKSASGPLKEE